MEAFIRASLNYSDSGDLVRVDSVLQVSSLANKALFDRIYREESEMCEALMEIMKDDIDKKIEKNRKEEKDTTTISHLRALMKKTNLSVDKAMDYLDIPVEDHPRYALMLKESAPSEYNTPQ